MQLNSLVADGWSSGGISATMSGETYSRICCGQRPYAIAFPSPVGHRITSTVT